MAVPPERLAEDLRTLIARGEALLSRLEMREVAGSLPELAEAAHKLAGNAENVRVPFARRPRARRLEIAADATEANWDVFAEQLRQAVPKALAIVRSQLAYPASHAA